MNKYKNLDYTKAKEVKMGKAYRRYRRSTVVPKSIGFACIFLILFSKGIFKWCIFVVMLVSLLVYLYKNAKSWKCPCCGKDLPMTYSGGSAPTPVLVHTCPYCKEDLTK